MIIIHQNCQQKMYPRWIALFWLSVLCVHVYRQRSWARRNRAKEKVSSRSSRLQARPVGEWEGHRSCGTQRLGTANAWASRSRTDFYNEVVMESSRWSTIYVRVDHESITSRSWVDHKLISLSVFWWWHKTTSWFVESRMNSLIRELRVHEAVKPFALRLPVQTCVCWEVHSPPEGRALGLLLHSVLHSKSCQGMNSLHLLCEEHKSACANSAFPISLRKWDKSKLNHWRAMLENVDVPTARKVVRLKNHTAVKREHQDYHFHSGFQTIRKSI